MLVREFEGKTEKEALQTALDTLQLQETQVRVESVDDGKVGFFGFRSKKLVKIKVYYEEQNSTPFALQAETYLVHLFEAMGVDATIDMVQEDEEKLYYFVYLTHSAFHFLLYLFFIFIYVRNWYCVSSRRQGLQVHHYHARENVEGKGQCLESIGCRNYSDSNRGILGCTR